MLPGNEASFYAGPTNEELLFVRSLTIDAKGEPIFKVLKIFFFI